MSGRGEEIQDLAPRDDFVVVLVYPGFPISTAQAYRWLDEDRQRDRRTSTAEDLKIQFEEKVPGSWTFFNSFQPTIERRYPPIGEILRELLRSGAQLATLSGSGSCVFGVFTDIRAGRSGKRRMSNRYPGAWLLVPLQSGGFAD
jgi:4-diphosphocytidyl-2-C-methyl-D-erythritol kinase